jgi:SAM-dependent methyltransferase
VTDFKFINGRRYHAFREGEYHLPNDETEQDRLDMQHALFRYALDGKLFIAPIPKEKLHNILDVGCGTGMWAIDVADENPQAQVLGFDLSPIQPTLVAPNCRFLVDDVNAEWVFAEKFDLVHTRAMIFGIKGWPRYLLQAYEHLNPGGFIELQDFVLPVDCTEATAARGESSIVKMTTLLYEGGLKTGLDLRAPQKLAEMLEAAGFKNVHVRWDKWPMGPWAKGERAKQLGQWFLADMKGKIAADCFNVHLSSMTAFGDEGIY